MSEPLSDKFLAGCRKQVERLKEATTLHGKAFYREMLGICAEALLDEIDRLKVGRGCSMEEGNRE